MYCTATLLHLLAWQYTLRVYMSHWFIVALATSAQIWGVTFYGQFGNASGKSLKLKEFFDIIIRKKGWRGQLFKPMWCRSKLADQ